MKVVIAGGSGFLGRALTSRLLGDGHNVTVLSRGTDRAAAPGRAAVADWSPNGSSGPWARAIDGADAVINLAGAGIADKRWNAARKTVIRSSRLDSTRSLVRAVEAASARPSTFIQGTAIGYYGAWLDERTFDESSPAGSDFLGQLCVEWEQAAAPLEALGCRLAIVRTGIVLDQSGGALPQMALPFKLFAGGPMASGRQVISWIHIADWLSMILWILRTPTTSGVYNATAPQPVTSSAFARALGRALHRPSWFPVPGFVLRAVVGEMATDGLIKGQRVVPARALAQGFAFAHPDLNEALRHALSRRVV